MHSPNSRVGAGGSDERSPSRFPKSSPGSPGTHPPSRSPRRPAPVRVNMGVRDVQSVYLGGNVMRNDWRRTLVSGLGTVGVAPSFPSPSGILWPRMDGAVVGRFDYVGPYSISGDPAGDAEWNSENEDEGSEWVVTGSLVGPQRGPRVSRDPRLLGGKIQASASESSIEVWWPLVRAARHVKQLVLAAIREADLYFAWIDTPLCAATLTEVGLAHSRGKIVWVAGPQAFDEMWLIYTLADQYSFHYHSPNEAFQNMLQSSYSNS